MALDAGTRMQQMVATDGIRVRVRKKSVGVSTPLAEATGDFGWVYADGDRANSQRFECVQILLDTPQLGVTEGSPVAPVEDEQDTSWRTP